MQLVYSCNPQVKLPCCDWQSEKMACGRNCTQQDPYTTDTSICRTRNQHWIQQPKDQPQHTCSGPTWSSSEVTCLLQKVVEIWEYQWKWCLSKASWWKIQYYYSLFDCRVKSHVDFARLYVEKYMAKFTAFDDHCDASAVLSLLGGVPVFSAAASSAGDVRIARNDWAHCVFNKWDPAKFQKSFTEMEQLIRNMALPSVNERELPEELKDWETGR